MSLIILLISRIDSGQLESSLSVSESLLDRNDKKFLFLYITYFQRIHCVVIEKICVVEKFFYEKNRTPTARSYVTIVSYGDNVLLLQSELAIK